MLIGLRVVLRAAISAGLLMFPGAQVHAARVHCAKKAWRRRMVTDEPNAQVQSDQVHNADGPADR